MASLLCFSLFVHAHEMSPVQRCVTGWQEYEILIRFMIDHDIVDIRFIIIDQYMIQSADAVRRDPTDCEQAANDIEHGLELTRLLIKQHIKSIPLHHHIQNQSGQVLQAPFRRK